MPRHAVSRTGRARAVLATLALAAGACGGDGDTTPRSTSPSGPTPVTTGSVTTASPAPTGPTGPAPVRSGGCGTGPAEGGERTIEVGGETRRYLLTLPDGYSSDEPAPVVFDFHGLGEGASAQARYSGLGPAGATRGYVVVTPQGSGGAIPRWALATLPRSKDATFFDALVDHLAETLCIDPGRVFATGISNGGAFSLSLACGPGHGLRAVASVAAMLECNPHTPPVPLLAFHGTADPIVPYEGGMTFEGFAPFQDREGRRERTVPTVPVEPVEDTVAAWARRNGCDADPVDERIAPDVRRRSYPGCEAPVVLYTIEGGGHTWPGAEPLIDASEAVGPTTDSIDATEVMLDFFDSLDSSDASDR